MRIGVPKETKPSEARVGLTPEAVCELTARGHEVLVETTAGDGIGASDEAYREAGASIAQDANAVFEASEMIVKVKEPLADDRRRLRPGQILFTYLHLAADRVLTEELIASGATCIAYETVTAPDGSLPLLAPMSEIAGRMSIQAAAGCLEHSRGGKGVLLGGAVGVPPSEVVILGGGIVGSNAAAMAIGLGASVTVVDRSLTVLRALNARFGSRLKTAFASREAVARLIQSADVVVGGVLVPGAAAPKIIPATAVKSMEAGSVIVDVAIDQGGCAETARPTTHHDPIYVVDDVVHYCVANMPGAVPRTAAYALGNATLPYVVALANLGLPAALKDPHLRAGLNIHRSRLTQAEVARDLELEFANSEQVLSEAA